MRIKMLIYILTAGLLILLSFLLIYKYVQDRSSFSNNNDGSYPSAQVEISGSKFKLEIAKSPRERQMGLMYRKYLEPNGGMLFIFDATGIYPFWMKDTYIPLDIIWLNREKDVVFIKENAQPCKNIVKAVCQAIIPNKPALYVIELNAGEVSKLNVKVGDRIDFEL